MLGAAAAKAADCRPTRGEIRIMLSPHGRARDDVERARVGGPSRYFAADGNRTLDVVISRVAFSSE